MSVSTSVLMYVNMVCFVVFRKNKMFFCASDQEDCTDFEKMCIF